MLLLTDVVGSDVRTADGEVLGQLLDLAVEVGPDHPAVSRLVVGRRRRVIGVVDWSRVLSFEHNDIELTDAASARSGSISDLGSQELLLARDVLDTQIVDLAGKRLARVSEVLLARSEDAVQVVAVEVGPGGVWRRLGFDRLAARSPAQAVDWHDLHLTSARGHALQLAAPGAAVHRLGAPELASVVAHLSVPRAAAVLDAVTPDMAAGALSASHPRVGARLLDALSRGTASSVVGRMPVDDATAVLRGLDGEALEGLLGDLESDRAATLRRLLAHPAGTAGGLMNTEVRTAAVGESVDAIRDRLAADMPRLEGLATVFVVDDAGRPVGSFEPTDLLAGRPTPRKVPSVAARLPVERVIDLFALQDHLALPVVDDDGRLVGVVAIDDVLEELLAERLPGQGPYERVRRSARTLGSRRRRARRPAGAT